MKQYIDLLRKIDESGTHKKAARANMPGTKSIFGYQFRHNLADGFPLLTTKKMSWKIVVFELFWFLRGDSNIKFLIDNGVTIWNQDAYNYYVKIASANLGVEANEIYRDNGDYTMSMFSFEEFCDVIKSAPTYKDLPSFLSGGDLYTLGDCGYQYGKVWRSGFCKGYTHSEPDESGLITATPIEVDQIKNLINGLKENPEGRRHIVTAIDPAHDTDLALYWCHAMVQFNCRPLNLAERINLYNINRNTSVADNDFSYFGPNHNAAMGDLTSMGIPEYYLDCSLYQRSADAILGVPYNIASYSLLTHLLATVCNMVPGEFIHSFGDVHIYDNHQEALEEQLSRTPGRLPYLIICNQSNIATEQFLRYCENDDLASNLLSDLNLLNYLTQPKISAKLSTGLK